MSDPEPTRRHAHNDAADHADEDREQRPYRDAVDHGVTRLTLAAVEVEAQEHGRRSHEESRS
jgi:hypothetical protein